MLYSSYIVSLTRNLPGRVRTDLSWVLLTCLGLIPVLLYALFSATGFLCIVVFTISLAGLGAAGWAVGQRAPWSIGTKIGVIAGFFFVMLLILRFGAVPLIRRFDREWKARKRRNQSVVLNEQG